MGARTIWTSCSRCQEWAPQENLEHLHAWTRAGSFEACMVVCRRCLAATEAFLAAAFGNDGFEVEVRT